MLVSPGTPRSETTPQTQGRTSVSLGKSSNRTNEHACHIIPARGEIDHSVSAFLLGRHEVSLEKRTEYGLREPDSEIALQFATRPLLDLHVALDSGTVQGREEVEVPRGSSALRQFA